MPLIVIWSCESAVYNCYIPFILEGGLWYHDFCKSSFFQIIIVVINVVIHALHVRNFFV